MSEDHSWTRFDNLKNPIIHICSVCGILMTTSSEEVMYKRKGEMNFWTLPPLCSEEQIRVVLDE